MSVTPPRTHAALKLADFGLYFGRPEFVVEFQAERDHDLQRREMNRQNAIRVGNTLYLFREPQDRIDYALVRALADEKALGFPCEKRCSNGEYKANEDRRHAVKNWEV